MTPAGVVLEPTSFMAARQGAGEAKRLEDAVLETSWVVFPAGVPPLQGLKTWDLFGET